VLNLASNNLGALVLPEGWTKNFGEVDGKYGNVFTHADGTKQMEHPGKPEGIIALANAIPDMGALSSVNLLKNVITFEQAQNLAGILIKHPALKSLCGNSGDETELDMRGKDISIDAGGAIMLAAEILGNRALTKLIFGGDRYRIGKELVTSEPATLEVGITKADLSNKHLGVGGAIIISAWISHKDNGALTSLNLSSNNLGMLVSRGGWSTTSGDSWKYRHTDGRYRSTKPEGEEFKSEGIVAIADAVVDMRALIKLDISSNIIGAEQEGDLQRICVESGIELTK
jgi:hypothetical protein